MRGEYNTELFGPLKGLYEEGRAAGTDVLINKNRFDFNSCKDHQIAHGHYSSMYRVGAAWGPQSALDLYLQEQGLTTLLYSGINADQVCIFARSYMLFETDIRISVLWVLCGTATSVDMIPSFCLMLSPRRPLLLRLRAWPTTRHSYVTYSLVKSCPSLNLFSTDVRLQHRHEESDFRSERVGLWRWDVISVRLRKWMSKL